MKKIILLSAIAFSAAGNLFAQLIDASPEISNICSGGSVTLSATITPPGSGSTPGSLPTDSYAITSVPYTPNSYSAGTPVPFAGGLAGDDQVSPALPIGFDFCFFNATYSQFYVGTNGWVGFSPGEPTSFTAAAIPSTSSADVPFNCIMGPWQDWEPGAGANNIRYETSGTAPFRKLSVSWENVPLFGCSADLGTFQIVIYETSNIIENYIAVKPGTCTSWGGTAVQGVHNAAGTVAFTVPGRNSTSWSANNEGWRYTPNGAAIYTINWYILPSNTLVGTGSPVTLTPVISPQYYYAQVTGPNGCGPGSDNTDTVVVNSFVTPADAGPDVSVCPGNSISMNASGGDIYDWTPGTGLSDSTIADPVASPLSTITYTVIVTNNSTGCSGIDSVTVTVNPQPIANAGQDTTICKGDSALLFASGGISYAWTPSSGLNDTSVFDPAAGPALTTTYTVMVTDASGCIAFDSVVVNINQLPLVNAGSDISICAGDSTALNATGALSYFWTPGASLNNDSIAGPLAFPSSATNYIVTGTDANGCVNKDSVTVSLNGITITPGPDQTICAGDSVTLSINGAPNYSWSPSATLSDPGIANPVAFPSVTTTYTVIGTSSPFCADTAYVTVNILSRPPVNAGTSLSTCTGANANLSVTGANSYVWSPASTLSNAFISTPIANPTITTLYTVTGTDLNGCSNTDTMTVVVHPFPAANAGANTSVCTGSSTTLNASGGGTYSWSPAAGLSSTNIANPVATPSSTTTYTVTVMGAGFCTASSQVTITVNSFPVASAGPDASICSGASTTLNASGGATYSWSPAAGLSSSTSTTPVAAPSATTQYTVTVTNTAGCADTDVVTVNVSSPIVIPPASVTDETCANGNGNITLTPPTGGTAPYSYSLNGGPSQSSASFSSLSQGNYTITITDAGGCSSSQTATVGQIINVNASFTSNPSSGPKPLSVDFTNTSTGATTYFWDLGNSFTTTTTNPSTVYTDVGTYTVMLIAANGGAPCIDTATFIITVYEDPVVIIPSVIIPNVFTPNGDGKNDMFVLKSTGVTEVKGVIFNRWGEKIYEWNGNADSGWDGSIKGGAAKDGTYYYLLNIKTIDGTIREERGYLQLISK